MSEAGRRSSGTKYRQVEAATDPKDGFGGLHIFIATDSANDRFLLLQLLKHLGLDVGLFELQDGAFRIPPLRRGNIVLCDTDGAAGQQALRDMAVAPDRPALIALTSGPSELDKRRLRQDGADAVLVKPVMDVDALAAVLGRWAGQALAPALPDEESGAADTEGETPDDIRGELAALRELAGPQHAQELLDQLGLDLDRTFEQLQAAVRQDNLDEIRAQTHILIALAGTTGAHRLKRAAERLNAQAHGGDLAAVSAQAKRVEAGLAALREEVCRTIGTGPDEGAP